MRPQITVLIVGAGPVGLSTALLLSTARIDIRVIDAGPDIDRRMRASTFHPPTLDMIETLGLGDELVRRGLKSPEFQMRQHETREHVTFDLGAISDATRHPFRLQVEQHQYCDLAIAALRDRGIEVTFDTRVDSVSQDNDYAHVTLPNETLRASWVVGADGANSVVRQSCGLHYGGMTHSHSSVLVSTTFPFHEFLDNLSNVSYCWSERGPFSLLRLRDYWRASLYPAVDDLDEAADEARIRDWLAYIHPDARDAQIIDTNPYRVHERCVDRFRVGRILLAGDAAHLNPPSGGMGMNGGIHDASNLCSKLLRVIDGADDSLLDRYHRQRHTLASQRIIPQAAANRARMATLDKSEQLRRLADQRDIAADPDRCKDFLLRSSMLSGLREAQSID